MNYREQLSMRQERAKAIIEHAERIITELEKRHINVDLHISLDYKININVYSLKELNKIRKVLKSIYSDYDDSLKLSNGEFLIKSNVPDRIFIDVFGEPSGYLLVVLQPNKLIEANNG